MKPCNHTNKNAKSELITKIVGCLQRRERQKRFQTYSGFNELRSLQIEKSALVRSKCRTLEENQLGFDHIRLKTKEWWETRYGGRYAG